MKLNRTAALAFATLIATGAAGGAAFAAGGHNEEAQDAQALANSKISLSQAITTAEQQTGGKAFDAGVDNNNGTARISVEVASNQGVKTVLVDPQTGQVIGINVGGDHNGQEND